MAAKACSDNGYEIDPEIAHIFTEYRKTHNQGVFDVYTHEMRLARTNKILTVFLMLTAEAVSSATTEELLFTV